MYKLEKKLFHWGREISASCFRPPNPELHYAAIPAPQRALVTKSLARVGGTQEREGVQSGRYWGGTEKHPTEGAEHDIRRRMDY